MRIAVISAGPSARRTFDADASGQYDRTIGVNAAACVFACDYWSVGDTLGFQRLTPVGLPIVFAMDDSRNSNQCNCPKRFGMHQWLTWESVRDALGCSPADVWLNWSATAAMGLAVHLGATEIDVYGVDQSGMTDVSGRTTPGRSDARWGREVPNWYETLKWVRSRGITVNVITESEAIHA